MTTATELETVTVKFNDGEEKPWEIVLDNVGAIAKARALLNFPTRHFADHDEALETGEKIRALIHADDLVDQDSAIAADDVYPDNDAVLTWPPSEAEQAAWDNSAPLSSLDQSDEDVLARQGHVDPLGVVDEADNGLSTSPVNLGQQTGQDTWVADDNPTGHDRLIDGRDSSPPIK